MVCSHSGIYYLADSFFFFAVYDHRIRSPGLKWAISLSLTVPENFTFHSLGQNLYLYIHISFICVFACTVSSHSHPFMPILYCFFCIFLLLGCLYNLRSHTVDICCSLVFYIFFLLERFLLMVVSTQVSLVKFPLHIYVYMDVSALSVCLQKWTYVFFLF